MTLTLVGLGPGHIDDLSRRAWRALETASTVYLRTERHPCVPDLPAGPAYQSFDAIYERVSDFAQVYATIVDEVMAAARSGPVVYAVPGDPLVGEATVTLLLERARAESLPVDVINGISFIEPTLAALGVDALDGLQVIDALAVAAAHHPPINPEFPALLGQVYSRQVASDVKLTLMNQYPDGFPVTLIHGAGTPDAVVETLPLHEIDHNAQIAHLTALYVPALGPLTSFEAVQEIVAHLRAPEGCPWDRKQTHQSLRQYLLEETYEVLEAIDADDPVELSEELGDLLLQIALHAQIAAEYGEFTMADVNRALSQKMIRRHPHVWGDVSVNGTDEVVSNWEAIKKQEHAQKGVKRESRLDGVPKDLPALLQAYRYQQKAAKVGFDWPSMEPVAAKVREELDELLTATDADHRAEEMGDLLFVLANWARWLEIEPETALRAANAKFARRFRYIEAAVAASGKAMETYPLAELDALWDEAKATGL
ncbi:MAG: nucleoside triphosphate pyrophosphohydrolase [Chloroflexi bacterium]|nr:nucleoside triphosphate pyrophosphohydrolase [Chloroflexota bacterium]